MQSNAGRVCMHKPHDSGSEPLFKINSRSQVGQIENMHMSNMTCEPSHSVLYCADWSAMVQRLTRETASSTVRTANNP